MITVAPIRGAMRRAYEGHEAIYEAVVARDIEAAERAMTDHLNDVAEYSRKARARD